MTGDHSDIIESRGDDLAQLLVVVLLTLFVSVLCDGFEHFVIPGIDHEHIFEGDIGQSEQHTKRVTEGRPRGQFGSRRHSLIEVVFVLLEEGHFAEMAARTQSTKLNRLFIQFSVENPDQSLLNNVHSRHYVVGLKQELVWQRHGERQVLGQKQ